MTKLIHAYIIENQTIAKLKVLTKNFVKTLICDDLSDKCLKCLAIENEQNSNVLYFDGFSEKIKNQDIKLAKEFTSYKNDSQEIKIVVLHGFEYATKKAANSFLKYLEDPYEQTIFIITTANKNLVLPTIVSRCVDVTNKKEDIKVETKYQEEINLIKAKQYWDINWASFNKNNILDFLITLSNNIDVKTNPLFVKGILQIIDQVKSNVTYDLVLAQILKLCEEISDGKSN